MELSERRVRLLGDRVRRLGLVGLRQLDELVTGAFQQGRRLGDAIVLESSLARRTQLRPELIRRAVFLGLSVGVVEAMGQ